jgi:hypothetical protein
LVLAGAPHGAVGPTTQVVYHADRLGSVRVLADAAGNMVQMPWRDEFGLAATSQDSSGQPRQCDGCTQWTLLSLVERNR